MTCTSKDCKLPWQSTFSLILPNAGRLSFCFYFSWKKSLFFLINIHLSIKQRSKRNFSSYLGCQFGQFYFHIWDACFDCFKGTYSQTYNAVDCIQCPEGFTTRHKGSTRTTDCLHSKEISVWIIHWSFP